MKIDLEDPELPGGDFLCLIQRKEGRRGMIQSFPRASWAAEPVGETFYMFDVYDWSFTLTCDNYRCTTKLNEGIIKGII